MSAEGRLHSMTPEERALALDVLGVAWNSAARGHAIVGAVRTAASALPEQHPEVSEEYAEHVVQAAVWYLDRAVRRVADPDRDGHTEGQRAINLSWFSTFATADDVERLFAMAAALDADDE
ncbi:MAG: hypothetical protein JOZ81_02580 [Chloroflexi bacterium]|nr:hypothetical protein [Chloroflexota bacterium]